MIKKVKILKISLMSLAASTSILATSLSIVSCGSKTTHKADFNDFKNAVSDAKAIDIVSHSNPAAKNWKSLTKSDLEKTKTIVDGYGVTVVIKAAKLNQVADFKITYIPKESYDVDNWTCSVQPHDIGDEWAEFQASALAEIPINIVANASTPAKGWSDAIAEDLKKAGDPDITNNTISIYISRKPKNEIARFSITYVKGATYKDNQWICSIQTAPIITWDDFIHPIETTTKQIILNGIVAKNPKNSNIDFEKINNAIARRFDLDKVNSVISDNSDTAKNLVTFKMYFKSNSANIGYDIADEMIITATIKYFGIGYSAADWSTIDYSFNDFTAAATPVVKSESWKKHIIGAVNKANSDSGATWKVEDCTFGNLEIVGVNDKVKLTITHNETSGDVKKVIVTDAFPTNSNNKVDVFGTIDWVSGVISAHIDN